MFSLSFSLGFAQESIEDLKRQLEEHRRLIQELERKIEALEKSQTKLPERPQKEVDLKKPMDRSLQLTGKFSEKLQASSLLSQIHFLPNISLIIDTSVVGRNMSDESYKNREIPGFFHAHSHEDGHQHGMNTKKGF